MNAAKLEYYHSLKASFQQEVDKKPAFCRAKRPGKLLISPDLAPITAANDLEQISPINISEPWMQIEEKSLVSPVSPPSNTTLPYSASSSVNYKKIRVNQPCRVLDKLMRKEHVER